MNRLIIDHFPVPAFIVNKNSLQIESINEKSAKLFNLDKENLSKYKITDFLYAELIIPGNNQNISILYENNHFNITLDVQEYRWNNDDCYLVSVIPKDDREENCIYKVIIESSEEGVFVIQDGLIKYVSPHFVSETGRA